MASAKAIALGMAAESGIVATVDAMGTLPMATAGAAMGPEASARLQMVDEVPRTPATAIGETATAAAVTGATVVAMGAAGVVVS
jgi:hypothetical protein